MIDSILINYFGFFRDRSDSDLNDHLAAGDEDAHNDDHHHDDDDELNGEGELHPLVTVTNIHPDEVPEVIEQQQQQ